MILQAILAGVYAIYDIATYSVAAWCTSKGYFCSLFLFAAPVNVLGFCVRLTIIEPIPLSVDCDISINILLYTGLDTLGSYI